MHLTGMKLGGVPPFTESVALRFDERVNVFIGPNASGKSTILLALADRFLGPDENGKRPISQGYTPLGLILSSDDEFDQVVGSDAPEWARGNFLFASEDWVGTKSEHHQPEIAPAFVYIGSVREGLPGISNQPSQGEFGDTSEDILAGPFSGARAMAAGDLLGKELRLLGHELKSNGDGAPYTKLRVLEDAEELADTCSQRICHEVIRDSKPHNYIPDPFSPNILHDPHADPNDINILRRRGINTTDERNFDCLSHAEQPAHSLYREGSEPPVYLGHASSGTETTLLWIRWLAVKMAHHYDFDEGSERSSENILKFTDGWDQKPAILLIDEIENHLHPTWQRRVIPALLEHFPGLQIFATTHSPFVVAGLKAGQVHLLSRGENGVVKASTNEQDIIGWTMDEILRTMMGVTDPTDEETAEAARELRELRNGVPAPTEAEEEKRQKRIRELRQKVDRDLLAGGPAAAQREIFEEHLAEILERHRQSQNLNQENG